MHGWAIAQRIRQLSDDILQVQQGSLYPALQRLEKQGWITADWGASENNRRARFYRLTKAGQKRLTHEEAAWARLSSGIGLVLQKGVTSCAGTIVSTSRCAAVRIVDARSRAERRAAVSFRSPGPGQPRRAA